MCVSSFSTGEKRNRATDFTAFSVLHTNYEPKISEGKQHLVYRTLFRNVAYYKGINTNLYLQQIVCSTSLAAGQKCWDSYRSTK